MMRAASLCLVVLLLAGCGRDAIPLPPNHGRCVSMADSINTLRPGDELPRVVQVLGFPTKTYRGYSFFGSAYDVLEYEIQPSACFKSFLDAEKSVKIVFDGKGRYVGVGQSAIKKVSWWTVKEVPMVIDPVVLLP